MKKKILAICIVGMFLLTGFTIPSVAKNVEIQDTISKKSETSISENDNFGIFKKGDIVFNICWISGWYDSLTKIGPMIYGDAKQILINEFTGDSYRIGNRYPGHDYFSAHLFIGRINGAKKTISGFAFVFSCDPTPV